jgi:tetratricopeptide (TPR) repeat protein
MWILPDGNMQRGLRLLERTASEGWYIQTEAAYFLSQIHYLYEDDYDETLRYALWLREAHPRNPYFHNFAGRVYFKWGRFDKARTAFAEVVARHEAGAPGYNDHQAEVAHYYLARVCMVRDAWREALYHLAAVEQFTADEDDDYDLKVLGRLRQGMVYDALGARDVAVTRYRGVLRMEDASGAHDRARRYLQTPYDG